MCTFRSKQNSQIKFAKLSLLAEPENIMQMIRFPATVRLSSGGDIDVVRLASTKQLLVVLFPHTDEVCPQLLGHIHRAAGMCLYVCCFTFVCRQRQSGVRCRATQSAHDQPHGFEAGQLLSRHHCRSVCCFAFGFACFLARVLTMLCCAGGTREEASTIIATTQFSWPIIHDADERHACCVYLCGVALLLTCVCACALQYVAVDPWSPHGQLRHVLGRA